MMDGNPSERTEVAMKVPHPNAAPRAWGLVLALAGVAAAQDAPPPLTPPADAPAGPAPTPTAPPRPAPRALLPRPELATPPVSLPPLSAPAEMGGMEPVPQPPLGPRTGPSTRPAPGPRPLTLESMPTDGLDPLPDRPTTPRARPPRTTTSEPAPFPTSPAPRRLRLFGRPQPAPPPLPRARESRREGATIEVEPRSDPAADAALQRRVEAQVRQALGPRLRALEVHVVDRAITIRARPARFWQRRAVRRGIETLPALNGYKAIIDVED